MGQPAFAASELVRLFEQVPAVVWACDRELRFTFGGGSALVSLGLRPNQLVGVPLEEYFGDRPEAARILDFVRRAVAGEHLVFETEWQGVLLESHVSPLRDAGGSVTGVIGLALDITERRRIEEELLVNRERLEHTTALFPIAHYSIDASGVLQLTREHRKLMGLPSYVSTVTYDDLLALVHPEDRQNVIEARALGTATREPYSFQCRIIRPDGSVRHLRFQASQVFDRQGRAVRTIGTVIDVTDEVQRHHQMIDLLSHDGLTGLPNRGYFSDRLRHELAFAQGGNEIMAVVLFDLDRFSRINDSLGHLAGDAYLRTIASRLRSFQEGTQDLAARIGGDEFALLIRGAQRRGDLTRRIESLRALIEEPIVIDEQPLHVTISIGVALYPYDAADPTLMQKADLALSRARSGASARTEYYDLMVAQGVASDLRLEHGLYAAVGGSQIFPCYQPIVGVDSRIRAVEALVRWDHPQYGLLAPAVFLEVAEESGLIVDVGEQMLLRSCGDVAKLRTRIPGLRLNVNLSSRHLLSRRLPALIGSVLELSDLPPSALQIEVTEQSLIEDVSAGRNAIESLRALGLSIVIDDFGTGYNTLSYLKSFQVEGIKLDRVFIKDMLTDRYSRAICEGVMAMARSLDLHVIAEGIESAGQRDAAIAMGCKELQGFLFGKPLALRDLEASLPA